MPIQLLQKKDILIPVIPTEFKNLEEVKQTFVDFQKAFYEILTNTEDSVDTDFSINSLTIDGTLIEATAAEINAVTDPTGRAQGDILYASAANTLAWLAKGAANLKLFVNAAGALPEWAVGIKIGTFTRNMTGGAGDVEYIGVGFKPSVIIFLSNFWEQVAGFSVGFDDGTLSYCIFGYGAASAVSTDLTNSIYVTNDNATYIQKAFVKTMDADGFTLTWAATGSIGQSSKISYLAFR